MSTLHEYFIEHVKHSDLTFTIVIVYMYQSQNRKGREILPSLSYHSNENNRQMEDDILKSVTYGGHWRLITPEKYWSSCVCKLN